MSKEIIEKNDRGGYSQTKKPLIEFMTNALRMNQWRQIGLRNPIIKWENGSTSIFRHYKAICSVMLTSVDMKPVERTV